MIRDEHKSFEAIATRITDGVFTPREVEDAYVKELGSYTLVKESRIF